MKKRKYIPQKDMRILRRAKSLKKFRIITRRENTHNSFFASTSNLANAVDNAFDAWAVPNDQIKSLCNYM